MEFLYFVFIHILVVKTGSDSPAAKRSAIGLSVTGP